VHPVFPVVPLLQYVCKPSRDCLTERHKRLTLLGVHYCHTITLCVCNIQPLSKQWGCKYPRKVSTCQRAPSLRRRGSAARGLLPVPRTPDPLLTLRYPLPWHPGGRTLRRQFPVSGHPLPAIIPGPVSRHPDMRRRGRHGHSFLAQWWRRLLYHKPTCRLRNPAYHL
jgi:hypothetical protein